MVPSIEILGFFKNNSKPGVGSFRLFTDDDMIARIREGWSGRWPGEGQTGTDYTCVVPIRPEGCFQHKVAIVEGMALKSEVTRRDRSDDTGVIENLFVRTSAIDSKPEEAKAAAVVMYSKKALGDGDNPMVIQADFGTVALLTGDGSVDLQNEPMDPLTMARNQLKKPGGTHVHYSSEKWAEAVWYASQRVARGG